MVELQTAETLLSEETTEQNKLEHELSILPVVAELKTEKQKLNNEIDALIERTRLAQSDSRTATYNDGYSKGEISKEMMDNEQYEQYRNSHFTTHNLALKAAASSDKSIGSASKRSNSLRPHELVRKMTMDQFNNEE